MTFESLDIIVALGFLPSGVIEEYAMLKWIMIISTVMTLASLVSIQQNHAVMNPAPAAFSTQRSNRNRLLTVSELVNTVGGLGVGYTCTQPECYSQIGLPELTEGPDYQAGTCTGNVLGQCFGVSEVELDLWNPGYSCELNIHEEKVHCRNRHKNIWCKEQQLVLGNCTGLQLDDGTCLVRFTTPTNGWTVFSHQDFCAI
jgi:hypothetical protein